MTCVKAPEEMEGGGGDSNVTKRGGESLCLIESP